MAYNFYFGDFESDKVFVDPPNIEMAQREGELVSIAGKSGDEYIDNGRYKNVEFERKISIIKKGNQSVKQIADEVIDTLAYLQGYQDFEDTDHEYLFTKAVLTNFAEVNRDMRKLYRATLRFSRIPFWYSNEGNQYQTVPLSTKSKVFENPYKLDAAPLIEINKIQGGLNPGNFSYSIGTKNYTAPYLNAAGTTVIDCEKQVIECNGTKLLGDTPAGFFEGSNTFEILDPLNLISEIRIKPRWRRL